jgi:putative SOS response-associated peptidase YedK
MCNLYSMTRNQDAIRRLFKVTKDSAGNLPTFPGIFPNKDAPVIRRAGDERELLTMYWGMPNPPEHGGYQTNIRNLYLQHWRQWLEPANRCLVPVTSFSEYAPEPNPATGKKDIVWFSIDDSRPLFAFAGIWTEWDGARGAKSNPTVTGKHLAYAFLTTKANEVVGPIHRKAMPVILHQDDWEAWLTADTRIAVKLQRPWPDDQLKIVARGVNKFDQVPEQAAQ